MYRLAVVVVLLLSTFLWAETQEEAYYRAMKAEESGDISAAVKAFEEAVALTGPYTAELQEILQGYYEALGIKGESEKKSPLSFRFLGDVGFNGLKYNESKTRDDVDEYGGDLYVSLTPFLDYAVGDYLHSFGLEASGDWFLMNDNMPALDTSDWNLSLGAEYALIGPTLMLNVGANLNLAEREAASFSAFGFGLKEFYRNGKNRFGAALWAYYKSTGPLSSALYATWNRTATYGWSGNAYLGVRFEADSVMNYKQYVDDYKNAVISTVEQAYDAGRMAYMDACFQEHVDNIEQCFEMNLDSLYWDQLVNEVADTISVATTNYYALWLGPALRGKVSYKFRTNITLEAKANLSYGFVLDGPDEDYEKVQKFSGTWGGMISWKPKFCQLYLGFEQIYRYYVLPEYYKNIYSKSSMLSQLKAGVKWEI